VVVISDPSFQLPSLAPGGSQIPPTVGPWTWVSFGGVVAESNGLVLDGIPLFSQAASMLCYWAAFGSGITASCSQILDFGAGGLFTFSGYSASIPAWTPVGLTPLQVLVDGVEVYRVDAPAVWGAFVSPAVAIAAGSHTVAYQPLSQDGKWGLNLIGLVIVDPPPVDPPPSPSTTTARPARWVPRPRAR
jgi:hypothetical protein